MTETAIWYQRVGDCKAHIARVNGRYRWQVWELWLDRWGQRTYPGRLIGEGNRQTLATAKRQALQTLAQGGQTT
jgi:hypothetical protein